MMKIKKTHKDAVLPQHAKSGDAGYDLVAINDGIWSSDRTYIEYDTGIQVEVPEGYHVELFARSSVTKTDLVLGNSVGLVDNGYRGNLKFRFKYIPRLTVVDGVLRPGCPILYKKGDKIGQIVIRKTYELPVEEVETLSETERGEGGFGSTDKPR